MIILIVSHKCIIMCIHTYIPMSHIYTTHQSVRRLRAPGLQQHNYEHTISNNKPITTTKQHTHTQLTHSNPQHTKQTASL